MKSKIRVFLLVFATLGLLFNACNKSEDLVTEDAQTGGLVFPASSIPYKLGATPEVNVSLIVPLGPGISTVEVYLKYYRRADTAESNQVLMKTIDVSSANASADAIKDYTITYADLINGLLIDDENGNPIALPSDETLLPIGDAWELSYISVLADGRRVINNYKTSIAVANIYAGLYQCDGVFTHPTAGPRVINEEKFLTPLSAYSCRVDAGDLGSSGYSVVITVDPATNDVSFSGGQPTDMYPKAERSYYDPETGKFYLHYFYVGATGNREMDEEYTPI